MFQNHNARPNIIFLCIIMSGKICFESCSFLHFFLFINNNHCIVQNAGSSTIHEVMTGLIQRLCDEVDPKELPLMYTCLFEEINCCLKDGCLEHLKCLIDFLAFALQKKQSNVFGQFTNSLSLFFHCLNSLLVRIR